MSAVENDQNSRAKEHDQNPSFFINFRVSIQRYSY